ncbi:carbamoyltransferase C-terminal domain-containing protein [Novipirellula galeiformis]|uniref:carbamoyltransferase C-terminal domain-containing protein n=1 Tax=Novipirellula galeiformis TaxID=2528004 RepID=UPI0011B734CE
MIQFSTSITLRRLSHNCACCPAAVHADGTVRPQLVTTESNPSFHQIVTDDERRTGISVLVNMSFSMHEEPINDSPQGAVQAFVLGNTDYLPASNFLVPHLQRAKGAPAKIHDVVRLGAA